MLLKDYILAEIENNNASALWIDEPWPTSLNRDHKFDLSVLSSGSEWQGYPDDDI